MKYKLLHHLLYQEYRLRKMKFILARKFYIRRNNSKVDYIETECIVITHLFPWSDLEKSMQGTFL